MENSTIPSVDNSSATAAQTSLDLINAIYPPVLIVVGVTCNIAIIFVMRTRYFRKQSTSVYMTAGAINDGLSLLISMTTHWLFVTFDGIYYKNNVKPICKFLDFYGWGNCDLGILITTIMTVDRALAITFPLKTISKNSTKRAKIVIVILIVIVVTKEFHFLIGSNMVDESRKERLCDVFPTSKSYEYFWKVVWPWLHLSFLICCFLVMIISNTILIFQVYKSSRKELLSEVQQRRSINNNYIGKNAPRDRVSKTDKQWQTITPMLIGESSVLLVFTFPFTVQLSISGYNPEFYSSPTMGLLFSITFYMLYTNKCVTFFVYLLTGSRFRTALKNLFIRCKSGKKAERKRRFLNTISWLVDPADKHSHSDLNLHKNGIKTPNMEEKENKDNPTAKSTANDCILESTHL